MNCSFSRRQGEDEPSVADVYGTELENIAKKDAIGLGILTVKENVGTGDHVAEYTSGGSRLV